MNGSESVPRMYSAVAVRSTRCRPKSSRNRSAMSISGTCSRANAMSKALTTGMFLLSLFVRAHVTEAEQLLRIVHHDAPPRGLVRRPGEHQVEQVRIVRHRIEVVRMRPVRAPQQAIRRPANQREDKR